MLQKEGYFGQKHCKRSKMGLMFTLEQTFYILERHEHGHGNFEIKRDVKMSESAAWNVIKHAGEMKYISCFWPENFYREQKYSCYGNRGSLNYMD
jgi:hypothetical protein